MAAASGAVIETTDPDYDCSPAVSEDMQRSPRIGWPVYCWTDITDDFTKAVKELELGELLHDNLFGLFEAMSAIEMMDPKMDAGMMCNRDNKQALSFDDLVESGALKMDNLLPSESIGIIDSTLACLVSWLEGHSLAQTVFTNLFLHRPYQVQDRVMKAFSVTIYKIIDIIKDFINRAMVFEEEDFQPMMYGYKLKPDVSESRAIGMLKEVEDELQKKMRNKTTEISQVEQQEELVGLHARMKFIRCFYQILLNLNKRESVMGVETLKLFSTCLDSISVLQKTVSKGIQPSEDKDHSQMMGFDPLINQRLLPPTFPRYTKVKSRVDALEYLEELLNRLKVVCRITTYTSFHSALDFFIEFSRHGPCILSRSIMQLLYLPSCNSYSQCTKVFGSDMCSDVLRDAAKTFIAPPALMPKSTLLNNTQAKEYVDSFLNHCIKPFGSLLQLCGHNRARQRDKLAHLLEDFATLQDEAERVDAYLHNLSLKSESPRPHLACFGTWVLYHTLRIMIMYLLSGLELELYSNHEYHYIFWYLYEFLYGWLVSALSRANSFLLEQELLPDPHNRGRGSKKNKPKKKKTHQPFGREMTLNQALQNMCGGYYKAMVGFKLDSKIPPIHSEFDNEQVRYEHRFAPFASLLTPPPMQYSEFKEMTSMFRYDTVPDSSTLYLGGCKHFHQARTLLESLSNPDQEVTELIRICKTNFVVLKILAGGHKKDSTLPPEFDFSCHQHFPIIKIT